MGKLDTTKSNLISKIDDLFGFNLSNKTDGVSYDFGQYKLNKLYKPLVKYFIDEFMKHLEDYTEQEAEKILGLFTDFYSLYYSNGDFGYFKNKFSTYQYRIPYSGKDTEFRRATKDCYYVKTSDVVNDMAISLWWLFWGKEISLKLFKKTKADATDTWDDKYNFDVQIEDIIDEESEEITGYKITFINREESKDKKTLKESKIKEALNKKNIDYNNLWVEKVIDTFLEKRGRDYFIHKRLKAFLIEELERYFFQMLKNNIQAKADILNIQTKIEEIKAKYSDDSAVIEFKIWQLMKDNSKDVKLSVYETAYLWILNYGNILWDLEEFKARLWNKKRKIVKQEYCITIGKIIEYETLNPRKDEIFKEILNNKDQLKEREELLEAEHKYLDKITLKNIKSELQSWMINMSINMVVDTKHFDKSSKLYQTLHERGQKKLYEDWAKLDGLLIKSENYQGLNLLLDDYQNQIQWVYIDPPFNLWENWDFLYKTDYLDGSWCSLLHDRYLVSNDLLSPDGNFYTRCDYNWTVLVRNLMNWIFGISNFLNEITINTTYKIFSGLKKYNHWTNALFLYAKNSGNNFFNPGTKQRTEIKRIGAHSWWERFPPERIFFGNELLPPKGRHRTFIQPKIEKLISEWRLRINDKKTYIDMKWNQVVGMPEYQTSEDELLNSNRTDIPWYSSTTWFSTENSEVLLKRVILSTTSPSNIMLDYFMWSATTQAVAHKLWRKYIGVEIGQQFEEFDIPRMKHVLSWKESGVSKEKDVNYKWWGYFQYIYLNQYEDRFSDNWYMNKIDWDINQLSNTDTTTIWDIKQILYPLSQLKDKIYRLDDEIIQG